MTEQTFVAREAQLEELNKCLDLALKGGTQFAFVFGEAGAGRKVADLMYLGVLWSDLVVTPSPLLDEDLCFCEGIENLSS